jgi:hypothetical protein
MTVAERLASDKQLAAAYGMLKDGQVKNTYTGEPTVKGEAPLALAPQADEADSPGVI